MEIGNTVTYIYDGQSFLGRVKRLTKTTIIVESSGNSELIFYKKNLKQKFNSGNYIQNKNWKGLND